MTWARLDDGFWRNEKVVQCSDAALGLYARAISYCADQRTDGRISKAACGLIKARANRLLELVTRGLFEDNGDGSYSIHDFLKYNPSAADLRERSAIKAEAGARGGTAKAVRHQRLSQAKTLGTHTDAEWREMVEAYGSRCLKCSFPDVVKDHIIPLYQGGSDHISNLQPLCRSCNSAKGAETTDYRQGRSETLARWLAPATKLLDDSSYPVPDPSRTRIPDPAPDARAREARRRDYIAIENLTGHLNKTVASAIDEFRAEHPAVSEEWVEAACEEAAANNVRSWRYVEAILKRWERDGFKADKRPPAGRKAAEPEPDYSRGVNTGAGLVVMTLEQEFAAERARKAAGG